MDIHFETEPKTIYGSRTVRCFSKHPATVWEMFETAARRFPDRPAIVSGDRRISFSGLHSLATRVASGLAARGLRRGDRVALLLDNTSEFVVSLLACLRAGHIVVPMNPRQSSRETGHIMTHSEAALLICEAGCQDKLPQGWGGAGAAPVIWVGGDPQGADSFETMLDTAPAAGDFAAGEAEDCVCLLYTSGTTGQPKGAMLTNLGIVHSLMSYQGVYGLSEQDVAISAVPASHATGLIALILCMATCGGCCVLVRAFKARPFLELAERERMTYTLMVPAMYNLCLLEPDVAGFDLSAWRVAGYGGAPIAPSTVERLHELIPNVQLSNVYGATETTSPSTMVRLGAFEQASATVGTPVPCADIQVVGEGGESADPGETGELMIAGPMVIPGYWQNEEANAASFDADGRWRSGDLGFVDADGALHIVDRRKDIINRGGYKIYCIEVEAILARHDAVQEAALVSRPDDVMGEKAWAFVHTGGAHLDEGDLVAFCRKHLSSYKLPDRIVFCETPLPRNPNGKIVKKDLSARFGDPAPSTS
ncbi:acyl--CoA ligase [Sagittula sp. NFXS13]|uniref:class I adenylate-forming enzyme family protein n=1 Tax=Sagittula sp. NFXS13 TaxID=2819095 RepID=UPI0032DF0734